MPSAMPTQPDAPEGFEFVEHTADWAMRVVGSDMEQLLIISALAMGSLLVSDLDAVLLQVERPLELDAFDPETLLVDWLSELAYWAEDEGLVFRDFSFSEVSDVHLKAIARGGRAAQLLKHIKAVTYHDLRIEKTEQGLEATVVFDV